jgi:putative transposase
MRRTMVDKSSDLGLARQCRLLLIGRTSCYYKAHISKVQLELMRQIDEIFTEDPTRGTRRICAVLKKRNVNVGRGKVRRLMQKLGLFAIYCKPDLSKPNPEHKKYPYLLRNMNVDHVNQVWSTDITYIRLKHGFVYLTAVIDWYSRYVLAWRLSTTLESAFCIEALEEALNKYGKPEIFNTDQGSQFTSNEFISVLKNNSIKISMDGRGRALDNVFVERLWRTVKYENVYLKDYQSISECHSGLKDFFHRYNNQREHQSLDYQFPAQVYFGKTIDTKVAA